MVIPVSVLENVTHSTRSFDHTSERALLELDGQTEHERV